MTQKLKILGVSKLWKDRIVAHVAGNGDWMLKQKFAVDDPRILPLIRKIEAAGEIDARYWVKR